MGHACGEEYSTAFIGNGGGGKHRRVHVSVTVTVLPLFPLTLDSGFHVEHGVWWHSYLCERALYRASARDGAQADVPGRGPGAGGRCLLVWCSVCLMSLLLCMVPV